MPKRIDKSGNIKKPFQIWWDEETKRQFQGLVQEYDPLMPVAVAVLKLIHYALKDKWIPGYIRKENLVFNKMASQVKDMESKINH